MRSPCSGSGDEVSHVDGDKAFLMRARDPGAELGCGPHGPIGGAVERSARFAWRVRPQDRRAQRPPESPSAAEARERELPRRRARPPRAIRLLGARPRPGRPAKRGADEARVGLDRRRVDAANFGGAPGERRELHRLEKGDEPLAVELGRRQRLERRLHRHVAIQSHELLSRSDALDVLGHGSALRAASAA